MWYLIDIDSKYMHKDENYTGIYYIDVYLDSNTKSTLYDSDTNEIIIVDLLEMLRMLRNGVIAEACCTKENEQYAVTLLNTILVSLIRNISFKQITYTSEDTLKHFDFETEPKFISSMTNNIFFLNSEDWGDAYYYNVIEFILDGRFIDYDNDLVNVYIKDFSDENKVNILTYKILDKFQYDCNLAKVAMLEDSFELS